MKSLVSVLIQEDTIRDINFLYNIDNERIDKKKDSLYSFLLIHSQLNQS